MEGILVSATLSGMKKAHAGQEGLLVSAVGVFLLRVATLSGMRKKKAHVGQGRIPGICCECASSHIEWKERENRHT